MGPKRPSTGSMSGSMSARATANLMLEAKNTRKRAEADVHLLANRLAHLQAEEEKARRKTEETKLVRRTTFSCSCFFVALVGPRDCDRPTDQRLTNFTAVVHRLPTSSVTLGTCFPTVSWHRSPCANRCTVVRTPARIIPQMMHWPMLHSSTFSSSTFPSEIPCSPLASLLNSRQRLLTVRFTTVTHLLQADLQGCVQPVVVRVSRRTFNGATSAGVYVLRYKCNLQGSAP